MWTTLFLQLGLLNAATTYAMGPVPDSRIVSATVEDRTAK